MFRIALHFPRLLDILQSTTKFKFIVKFLVIVVLDASRDRIPTVCYVLLNLIKSTVAKELGKCVNTQRTSPQVLKCR